MSVDEQKENMPPDPEEPEREETVDMADGDKGPLPEEHESMPAEVQPEPGEYSPESAEEQEKETQEFEYKQEQPEQDASYPYETEQAMQDAPNPYEAQQPMQDPGYPYEAQLGMQNMEYPYEAEQLMQDPGYPYEAQQGMQNAGYPYEAQQPMQDPGTYLYEPEVYQPGSEENDQIPVTHEAERKAPRDRSSRGRRSRSERRSSSGRKRKKEQERYDTEEETVSSRSVRADRGNDPFGKSSKKKSRVNVLFVTEDGKRVRSVGTTSDRLTVLSVLSVLILVTVIGYIVYIAGKEDRFKEEKTALEEQIRSLSEDIIVLTADKEELENELRAANALLGTSAKHEESDSVNLLAIPSGLPISGAVAVPSKYSAEKQYITFMTGGGSKVVAAGEGKVVYSGESVEFGYAVRVDHGNGYVTTYYEKETKPAVQEGAAVKRGDTLYVVNKDNQTLVYQIAYEDQFVDPYTVMDIDG